MIPIMNKVNESRYKIRTELIAGLSTYMTMSYIFILNPILLSQVGIDINSAFVATIITGILSTLLMAVWAKVPFAVAPVPSITTFFVGFVCTTLGIPWQAALVAVFISGFISVGMALLSVREKLITNIGPKLSIGILYILCAFLVCTGFKQAGILTYSDGFLDTSKLFTHSDLPINLFILLTGLGVTLLLSSNRLKIVGAPVIGIFAATIVAFIFGKADTPDFSLNENIFSSFFSLDFSYYVTNFSLDLVIAILIFFIIDFFAGIGKYIGLFAAIENRTTENTSKLIGRKSDAFSKALQVDGWGNVIGALAGASSVAVYVSSAVGIQAGGKSGVTALFIALFMLLSVLFIPFIGSIPVIATSGVLVYIGFLLVSSKNQANKLKKKLNKLDSIVIGISCIIVMSTYSMDFAMSIMFTYYALELFKESRFARENYIFYATSVLLGASVFIKYLVI